MLIKTSVGCVARNTGRLNLTRGILAFLLTEKLISNWKIVSGNSKYAAHVTSNTKSCSFFKGTFVKIYFKPENIKLSYIGKYLETKKNKTIRSDPSPNDYSEGQVPYAQSGPVPYAQSGPVPYAQSGQFPYSKSGLISYGSKNDKIKYFTIIPPDMIPCGQPEPCKEDSYPASNHKNDTPPEEQRKENGEPNEEPRKKPHGESHGKPSVEPSTDHPCNRDCTTPHLQSLTCEFTLTTDLHYTDQPGRIADGFNR